MNYFSLERSLLRNGKAQILNYFLLLPISRTMIAQLFCCFTTVVQLYAANCKNVFPGNFYRFFFFSFGKMNNYMQNFTALCPKISSNTLSKNMIP